jgi:hypothetical protein
VIDLEEANKSQEQPGNSENSLRRLLQNMTCDIMLVIAPALFCVHRSPYSNSSPQPIRKTACETARWEELVHFARHQSPTSHPQRSLPGLPGLPGAFHPSRKKTS